MKRFLSAAILSAGLAAYGAVIEQETLELGLQGGMTFDSPDGDTEFAVDASLGYFFLDNIQAGGILGTAYNGRDMGYRFGGFGEINFDIYSAVMPYLAARVMYSFGDYYPDNFVLVDGAAGLKFFISETLAVALEIFYDLASEDVYAEKDGARNYDSGLRLGLRHYF